MIGQTTQVGIVGAGPAGLTLAQLLKCRGIESVVLENRSREYCEQRLRAGVLEQGTVDMLSEIGAGERLAREGIVHHGVELQFDGERHRIPLSELTGGATIVIYGQTEVVKDLIALRLEQGDPLVFEAEDVALCDVDGDQPRISYRQDGQDHMLRCDVIAGCDGFHGVSRPSIPEGVLRSAEREYPYGWLGILADVAPSTDELVYAHHSRGFALHSLRSPTISRLYLQVAHDEDIGRVAGRPHLGRAADPARVARLDAWPRGRCWRRASPGCAASWSSRCSTGSLFLAGDAAHIVPPTGAKGLNLAIADVELLGDAIARGMRRATELPGRLLAGLSAAGVAGRALLLVDDLDASPAAGRRSL